MKYTLYLILLIISFCFYKCSTDLKYNYEIERSVSSFVTDSLEYWMFINEDSLINLDIKTKCAYTYELLDSIIIPEAKKHDRTLEIVFSFWEKNTLKPFKIKSLYGFENTIKIDTLDFLSGIADGVNNKFGLSSSKEQSTYLGNFEVNGKFYENRIYIKTKYTLECGQTMEVELFFDPK